VEYNILALFVCDIKWYYFSMKQNKQHTIINFNIPRHLVLDLAVQDMSRISATCLNPFFHVVECMCTLWSTWTMVSNNYPSLNLSKQTRSLGSTTYAL